MTIAPSDAEDATEGSMPSVAKPFALFGAAAGLFAILGVGGFRAAAREVSPLTPMLMTAAVAACAGEVLRRWEHLHRPTIGREAVAFWVAVVSAAAGGVSGGLVGFSTWGSDGTTRFALGGVVVGLAFAPSCLVVFDAAKRAGRARHGSLVAETDRRTVLSTVLAGVAFAGATSVPATLSANMSNALGPLQQIALAIAACLGATAAIVHLQRQDKGARAALEAHAKEAAWLEPAADEASHAAGSVDLGLGADRWSRGRGDYRSSGRADVVLRGSVDRALAAFDECARRRHRSLLVAAGGLTAVTVAFVLRLSVYL